MNATRTIAGIQHAFGISILHGHDVAAKAYQFVCKIDRMFSSIKATISLWNQRSTDRNAIANMTPRILQDIGMDSVTAHNEANKPFWKE